MYMIQWFFGKILPFLSKKNRMKTYNIEVKNNGIILKGNSEKYGIYKSQNSNYKTEYYLTEIRTDGTNFITGLFYKQKKKYTGLSIDGIRYDIYLSRKIPELNNSDIAKMRISK